MKTNKILALISFLSAIIFIINGTGAETFYYRDELDGMIAKSAVFLPLVLAIALGIIVLVIIIKKKGRNLLLISLALLGIIIPIGVLFFFQPYSRSISSMKIAKLSQLVSEMEICYSFGSGEYPEIKVQNGYVENTDICGYPMPENPIKYERILDKMFVKTTPFKGISNTDNRDKYCIYTKLWEWEDEFFAASHQGTKQLHKEPTSLDDCY